MKTRPTITIAAILGLVAGAWIVSTFAQPEAGLTRKEFMREKLEHSQLILKGLTMEDYELIIQHGKRLSAMSREADWRVFENPDYDAQSLQFRQSVDRLVKAAGQKNLDGATLAYVSVTVHCVECHKFVRGKLVASVAPPIPPS